MINLGISLYPNKSDLQSDLAYIDLAAKYQVTKVFTNLLEVSKANKQQIIRDFKVRIEHAKKYNMEIIVDVSPTVFKDLNIKHNDLTFFKQLQADTIRLDENFNGINEALMSFNKYNIKIEVNASTNVSQIKNILAFMANPKQIVASHNFYPQKYTGLDDEYFYNNTKQVKQLNIETSAFISSNNKDSFGPWDINEGLITLEKHRYFPIDLQARDLIATGLIDSLTIANCYASEAEFISLSKIINNKINLKIDLAYQLSEVEKAILYHKEHYVRGDISKYLRRSTMTRIVYANESIKPQNTRNLKRGDIVILNDNYGRYKGELHIVLEPMENSGNKNVIGTIPQAELFMLDYLKPWSHFIFIK